MAGLPAYMRVRRHVVDLVRDHADTSVRIKSERELAAEFGVSRIVARQALKDLVDDGWLESRPGKGMFVTPAHVRNDNFTLRPSHKLLVLLGDGKQVDIDGFFMEVLARVFEELKTSPVRLCLTNITVGDSGAFDELLSYNPDGVLWIRPEAKTETLLGRLAATGLPTQVVGNLPRGDGRSATMDYFQAGRLAAAWFLDHGFPRAVFVGHAPHFAVKSEVFRGWLAEHRSRGLPDGPVLPIDTDFIAGLRPHLADGTFVFGSELVAAEPALASAKGPLMTDNSPVGQAFSKLVPAVRLKLFDPELGAIAARRLIQKLADPGLAQADFLLPPEIATPMNKVRMK